MAKMKSRAPREPRRPIRITSCNQRGFYRKPSWNHRQGALVSPELRWMDQLLRSFSQETPQEWLPAQYQAFFHPVGEKKRTFH